MDLKQFAEKVISNKGALNNLLLNFCYEKPIDFELIKFLIGHGANANLIERYGDTPLALAISQRNMEVTKYLVEHGARVTSCYDIAIKTSQHLKFDEITEFLLEKKVIEDQENLLAQKAFEEN